MFCRNCGREHDNLAVVCMNCGVAVGTGNNFCPNCGIQTNPGSYVCPNCGITLYQTQIAAEQKSKIVAGILGILLGAFGVHNFYLGYTGKAVARTSYNECLIEYVEARCSNTDVYPLTDDLILILQRASELKGWADFDNDKSDYLFKNSETGERIPGADPEIAWMYCVCY